MLEGKGRVLRENIYETEWIASLCNNHGNEFVLKAVGY